MPSHLNTHEIIQTKKDVLKFQSATSINNLQVHALYCFLIIINIDKYLVGKFWVDFYASKGKKYIHLQKNNSPFLRYHTENPKIIKKSQTENILIRLEPGKTH